MIKEILLAQTLDRVKKLGEGLSFAGVVETNSDLPETYTPGKIFYVRDTQKSYAYTEDGHWEELGTILELDELLNRVDTLEQTDIVYTAKVDNLEENIYTKTQMDIAMSTLSSRISSIERTVTTDTTTTSATLSAVAGNDYVYTQDLTSLSISFGEGSHGDLINIAFRSGITATTLTLFGNNYTTDISTIDANSIIEISAKYVIDRWVVWAKGTAIT